MSEVIKQDLKTEALKLALEAETLKQMLWYDPATGVFRWRFCRGNGQTKPWSEAGYYNSYGYRVILVNRKPYPAHRLAWLYMTGEMPSEQIDHINLVKDDNRFCNLRKATISQNQWNTGIRSTNKSGTKGVYFDERKQKWFGSFRVNGNRFYTKGFETSNQAAEALSNMRTIHHDQFAGHQ